jgi:hypothetical protein
VIDPKLVILSEDVPGISIFATLPNELMVTPFPEKFNSATLVTIYAP